VLQQPYSFFLRAAGGTPPYMWALDPGSVLPGGLSLNPGTGEVAGVPTQTGINFQFNVTLTDSANPPVSRGTGFLLTIRPPLGFSVSTLNDAIVGISYSAIVGVVGGIPPFTGRVSSGSLPTGFTLGPGVPTTQVLTISGTPSTPQQSNFTLEVVDSSSPPVSVSQAFSLRVNSMLQLDTTALPEGLEGQPYSAIVTASGGLPPYAWSPPAWFCNTAFPGCPPNLMFDTSQGTLTGTPAGELLTDVRFTVTDASNPPQSALRDIPIRLTGLLRVTSSLPPVRVGAPIYIRLGASGGTPPFSWSLSSGTLPSGLSLDPSTGEITGTPTMAETQSFTVQVTDSSATFPQTTQQPLQMTAAVSLGRNDSIATATPLSNGRYRATISPFADPVGGPANPDTDYYAITAPAGALVHIELIAAQLSPPSRMDVVAEIVDSNGSLYQSCSINPFNLNAPCRGDDITVGNTDFRFFFKVPGTPGTPVTFFLHVADWTGGARPELRYEIEIVGAS